MTMREIKKKQARIRRIQQRLSELGAMRPGSLSRQYNVCGNPQCRCKDPVKPKKHGPYHQLGYYSRGKHTTEFIKEEELREVKTDLPLNRRQIYLFNPWKLFSFSFRGEFFLSVHIHGGAG